MMMAKEKIKVGFYFFIKALSRILSRTNLNRIIRLSALLLVVLLVPTLLAESPPAELWQPEVKVTFVIASMAFLNYYLTIKN